MEIFRKFTFEAAHCLPRVSEGHKCSRIHGHSFSLTIYVSGPIDKEFGWVVDFAGITQAIKPILDQLDHRCLNDVEGLENPTTEHLAQWIWTRLKAGLPQLSRIIINETSSSGCMYRGEDD